MRRPGRKWETNMHGYKMRNIQNLKKDGISEEHQQTIAQHKSKKARKSTVRNECMGYKSKECG